MQNFVYAINEDTCIECGQCRRYCPLPGAIIINEHYQHMVVADICSGCGICEAFCPVPQTLVKTPHNTPQTTDRLEALRRAVWRHQWSYHDHPVMSPLTVKARQVLRESNKALRAQQAQSR